MTQSKLFIFFVFSIFFFPPSLIAENWYPQTYIITDGDTLKRNGVRYRLEGLDAPEINQICTLNNQDWECGLAAALSTAAGLLLVISTSVSHDLIKKQLKPDISDKGELTWARVSIFVAILILLNI